MSEHSAPKPKRHSDFHILLFVIILCATCGFLLAVISFSLRLPQEEAKAFDQSKQMLIAAKILNPEGYFEILQEDSPPLPARFDDQKKVLVPLKSGESIPPALSDQIKEISLLRIRPLLTDSQGKVYTLKEKGIDLTDYLAKHKKTGYAHLPLKLFYAILPNDAEDSKTTTQMLTKDLSKVTAVVIPISGNGLWAPIYGYLALSKNADNVIGTTWYDQAETPGLGANISTPVWQKQFYNKVIFQQSSEGKTDFKTAPLGITVVKGTVKDVYGDSPRSKSAVDGISGATLTGNGVTEAYRDSLAPYRAFLIYFHNASQKGDSDAASS